MLEKQLKAELQASKQETVKAQQLAAAEASKAKAALVAAAAAAGSDAQTSAAAAASGGGRDAELENQIKSVRNDIKFYKELDECRREECCQARGGYQKVVDDLEARRLDLQAQRRGCKPTKVQLESADAHQQRLGKLAQAAKDSLEDLQKKRGLLDEGIAKQAEKVGQLEADLAKAKKDHSLIAIKLAEEGTGVAPHLSAQSHIAVATSFVPGTASWTSLEKVVGFAQNSDVLAALAKAGMAKEEFDILGTELSTVRAAADAQLQAGASTQLQAVQLQAQLEEVKAATMEMQSLWADMDQDLASDTESVAPSETGEQGETRRLRKVERMEQRTAKRKKLGESVGKVASKFGVHKTN